jgi:DMSO reductase anchor subunit
MSRLPIIEGPVELIPARPQTLWGWPAVANFALGGTGAGFYVAAAVAARLGSSPSLTIASWLGPALVLAGFAAVALEAGRPRRGPRVLTRLATSWMSRELALGGLFALLAASEFLAPGTGQRLGAAAAALALVLAQGAILRHARGIAAWSVSPMPLVFLQSALVAGTGLMVALELLLGAPFDAALIGAVIASLPFAALVWLVYITWSGAPFADATRPLREGPGFVVMGGGYVAPLALFGLALALGGDRTTALLGGLLLVAAQAYAKTILILRCGQLRPITVPDLRLRTGSPEKSGSPNPTARPDRFDVVSSAGSARAIRLWGEAAERADRPAERRKGGEAPLRGERKSS